MFPGVSSCSCVHVYVKVERLPADTPQGAPTFRGGTLWLVGEGVEGVEDAEGDAEEAEDTEEKRDRFSALSPLSASLADLLFRAGEGLLGWGVNSRL